VKTIRKNVVIPSTLTQARKVTPTFLILASLTFLVISSSNLQFAFADKSSDTADLEFIEQFGTSGGDDARGVFVDSLGDVYVVGITGGTLPDQTSEGGEFDAFIRKYNSDGDEEWTRQFGTSEFDTAIEVTGDSSGGVYVVGNTDGEFPGQTNVGGSDSFIRKYNSDGDEEWTRQFGTSAGVSANGVSADSSGGVYVVGVADDTFSGQTSEGESDAYIRKYNSDGDEEWTRQFGTSEFEYASDVSVDSSGGVYVVGNTDGEFPGQTREGDQDAFIRKYNSDGDEEWTRQFGTSETDFALGVSADSSGSVYVVGIVYGEFPGQTNVGGEDAYIRKYNSDGDEEWTRQFGTSGVTEGNAVFADSSGRVYVVGLVDGTLPDQTSEGGEFDAFIRKYNSDGDEEWTRQFGTSGRDVANRVYADSSGSVYVVGSTTGTFPGQTSEGGSDAFLAKFSDEDHNKKHHDDDDDDHHKKKR
jgi:phage repressor protein C with HTH and peptisase S24 domain